MTQAQIGELEALGFTGFTTPVVSVSYFLANQSTLDASGNITIDDTAANVGGRST